MELRKLSRTLSKALQSLDPRDMHDTKGELAPNELAFKMLVLGALTALGWECASESRVDKADGGYGFIDLEAKDPDGVGWFIELKYHSLAYWNARDAPRHNKNEPLHQKQAALYARHELWVALAKHDRLSQQFFLPGVSDEELAELDKHQCTKYSTGAVSLVVEVLVERAKRQVRNYTHAEGADVRRCVILGFGPTCIVELADEE